MSNGRKGHTQKGKKAEAWLYTHNFCTHDCTYRDGSTIAREGDGRTIAFSLPDIVGRARILVSQVGDEIVLVGNDIEVKTRYGLLKGPVIRLRLAFSRKGQK